MDMYLQYREKLVVGLVSVLVFYGKHPEFFASAIDSNYVFNSKTVAFGFIMLLIVPLIGSLPNADIDKEAGTSRYLYISRFGVRKYYSAQCTANFVLGFLNVLYVFELLYLFEHLAINTAGSVYLADEALIIDFMFPDVERITYFNLLISHPYLFDQLVFILTAIFGGLCGSLTYSLNHFITTASLSYTSGFLIIPPLVLPLEG